ncbi:MAG: phosphoglucosamine mutase [Methanomicrobiales archaeon]|nr:phosphoglucosamine mutase [Methanomicrobiales archaeon]
MTAQKMEKALFGTNGVRGVVGEDMTPALSLKIGMALGSEVRGTVAVGRDTRTSGESLGAALKAGLMACGCDVLDVGILPTPALQFLVRGRCKGGAMITASHNPPQYNGVKVIAEDGTEMGDEDTVRIEQRILHDRYTHVTWQQVGTEMRSPALVEEYIRGILQQFPADMARDLIVAVDPGSGAGAHTTPAILSRLGCRALTINATLDGTFPGRLPEPSPEGLKDLAALVTAAKAAFGAAHDGDADRTVFIDDQGRYVEENKEFALIAQSLCRERKGILVMPVSTSTLVEEIARSCGCEVEYTPVGSIYVARRMIELQAQGAKVVMGGEGNGGLIYPRHQFCRDGAMTAATMAWILVATGKPLSTLIDQLPQYTMIKEKISTPYSHAVLKNLDAVFAEERLDRTDGLKIIRDHAWALVRASGTEPLIRIMVESNRREIAEDLCREVREAVETALRSAEKSQSS